MTTTGLASLAFGPSLAYANLIPGCERVVTTRRETVACHPSSIRASRHSRAAMPRSGRSCEKGRRKNS